MVNTTALSFSKPSPAGVGLLKPQHVLKQGKQRSHFVCIYGQPLCHGFEFWRFCVIVFCVCGAQLLCTLFCVSVTSRDVKTGRGCAVPFPVMALLTAKQQEFHTMRTAGSGRLVLSILHTTSKLVHILLPPWSMR
jgi:hypothetical protein